MYHQLIEALKQYELTVAELYATFADVYPDTAAEWRRMVSEEQIHAKWVDALYAHVLKKNLSLAKTAVTLRSVSTAIDYVQKIAEKVRRSPPPLLQAVSLALDIEKSILESAFVKVFDFSSVQARLTQDRLLRETRLHLEQMTAWQAELKKHSGTALAEHPAGREGRLFQSSCR
jgi:hypothetical protein